MILAQVATDGLGGYSGMANLGAVGAVIALLAYLIIRGMPDLFKKVETVTTLFAETTQKQRDDFREELKQGREDFREELKTVREQSNKLATGGHDAVNNLTREVGQLRMEIRSSGEKAG